MSHRSSMIFVHGLELSMRIGIYPEEKLAPQRVLLDIEGECLLPEKLEEDIAKTVSYETFIDTSRKIANERHFALIETFCEDLSAALLMDGRLTSVTIRARKPDVFKGNPESVGVKITRTA